MSEGRRLLITGASGFIGANAVDYFMNGGYAVRATDQLRPSRLAHEAVFTQCDLLDGPKLEKIFREFAPQYLLHLGAVTDTHQRSRIDEYAANIEGVQNVLAASNATPSLRRIIITSSRLVCRIGYQPASDQDYAPPNAYGQSKVETERIVRTTPIHAEWLITRPTAIWGNGFLVPSYRDFFEQIRRGRYVHFSNQNPHKTFGYVRNFTFQMEKLLLAPREQVQGRVFYIGDYEPVRLRDWADLIASEFGRKPIPTLPLGLVRVMAKFGDGLKSLGWSHVPLTSYRLSNMLAPAVYNLSALEEITGPLPYDLAAATRETVAWLKTHASFR